MEVFVQERELKKTHGVRKSFLHKPNCFSTHHTYPNPPLLLSDATVEATEDIPVTPSNSLALDLLHWWSKFDWRLLGSIIIWEKKEEDGWMLCGPVGRRSTWQVSWPNVTQNSIIFTEFSNVTLKKKTYFERTTPDTAEEKAKSSI